MITLIFENMDFLNYFQLSAVKFYLIALKHGSFPLSLITPLPLSLPGSGRVGSEVLGDGKLM
jgi:hypothetical protein